MKHIFIFPGDFEPTLIEFFHEFFQKTQDAEKTQNFINAVRDYGIVCFDDGTNSVWQEKQ